MIVRTPWPSSPTSQADRVVELRLAAGVAAVAQLVLEALDAERVAGAVRQHPGHQEARQPGRRLGQHQEQVAHRRAGEPLVPAQPVRAVAGWRSRWSCWRGRPSRPASRSSPCRRAGPRLVSGVRRPGSYSRLVSSGSYAAARSGAVAQRRDHRVGHRDRAGVAGLDLGPDVEAGGPGHVRARPVVGPRRRRPGPRRRPRSISRCQDGWNSTSSTRWPYRSWVSRRGSYRLASSAQRCGSAVPASLPSRCRSPTAQRRALPGDAGQQRRVGRDVVVDQRRRLVEDLVGSTHPGNVPLDRTDR